MKCFYYESDCFDPYRNLAVEEHLLQKAEDAAILYLWQNRHTVVIGKNQNPWKECKTTLLEQEGGHLARRLSGGGAVYHDLGNLNFTILMPQREFDLEKQFSVILEALKRFGIDASLSGRNDITVAGQKFSGNAFYKNGRTAYHHGTLLVDADMERLSRYLSPPKAKLEAKGVDSVRSRVVNLRQLCPDITVERLKQAVLEAFSQIYGAAQVLMLEEDAAINALTARNRSWQWNYGQKLPFTCACEGRFSWGGVQIELQVESGRICAAKVWSDAMDWQLPLLLEQQLTGCRFAWEEIAAQTAQTDEAADLQSVLATLF